MESISQSAWLNLNPQSQHYRMRRMQVAFQQGNEECSGIPSATNLELHRLVTLRYALAFLFLQTVSPTGYSAPHRQ